MGAILKVRDDEGNIIEIPALKGDGDMNASVYDTEGKKRDVYEYTDLAVAKLSKYLEKKISDAIGAAIGGSY